MDKLEIALIGARMTPFIAYLLSMLDQLHRDLGGPVRSAVLADTLGQPLRTTQWYLAQAEGQGVVTRRSPKTGWLPAR